ncbi:hypothetical protein GCM10010294_23300 [Streptomyces griseoloalbus]|uniref:hypothetical protein n=1 Tax=Streptomyces griseoloalbus TaxID=67303 RepID=UPI00187541F7|nr:hypothetical protein GCM10010294_23300 [Streptomyces griseoloalbus]
MTCAASPRGRARPPALTGCRPAIHRNRGEIREIFAREMSEWGRPAPEGLTDTPAELAEAAPTRAAQRPDRPR